MPKVLLVATSHDKLGDTDQSTGAWLEEIAAPYYTWSRAGVHVDISSPDGKPIPIDAASTSPPFFTSEAKLFHDDSDAMAKLSAPLSLNDIDPSGYDAIFIAGGHGIVYDGPEHSGLKRALESMYKRGAVVSAVCHGPCGLVSAVKDDNTSILAGHKVRGLAGLSTRRPTRVHYQVTGFTNSEEEAVGKTSVVPWLLEDKLNQLSGGLFERGPDWTEYVITDRNLVTGQNPQSSTGVAKAVLALLI